MITLESFVGSVLLFCIPFLKYVIPGNFLYPYFLAISLSVVLTIVIPYSDASSSISSMCRKIRRASGSCGSSLNVVLTKKQNFKINSVRQNIHYRFNLQKTTARKSFEIMYSNNVLRSISSILSSVF